MSDFGLIADGPDLTGPLPLPARWNLDEEKVPWAEPGAGSFAGLEALAMRWRQRRADRLRCHPGVAHRLQMTAPLPPYPALRYESLFALTLTVDAGMPRGAWKLMEGDEVLQSGVITDE